MNWRRVYRRLPILPVAAVLFVMAVHLLPHVPGPASTDTADAYPALWERLSDLPDGYAPYPLHVDEHAHGARAAQIIRNGTIEIPNPYTGIEPDGSLFTVQGFRSERGFDLATAQFSLLTGLPMAGTYAFLQLAWVGLTAGLTWMLLRGAPGVSASTAALVVLPTSVLFLGVGFLIPASFGLTWMLAALVVAFRTEGLARLAGLALLITGAHFMHLVPGVLTFAAAVVAPLAQATTWRRRASRAAMALLPMIWILPLAFLDIQIALAGTNALPFEPGLFLVPGILLYLFSMAGAARAFWRWDTVTAPHRALTLLLIPITLSMALSIRFDHHSDGTYTRLVHTYFLAIAVLAGLGIGALLDRLRQALPARMPWGKAAIPLLAGTLVTAIALAPAVHDHLNTPYYRIFNEASWQAGQEFASTDAGPGDVFLSHPWRAPVYNTLTGAYPHAVLYPGSPPVNNADWTHYVQTRGADTEWLEGRNIRYVVSDIPPNAPHDAIAPNVYIIHA